jgi:hypothetical protein
MSAVLTSFSRFYGGLALEDRKRTTTVKKKLKIAAKKIDRALWCSNEHINERPATAG